MTDVNFILDARLEADTTPVLDWPLCRVLAMNDARFSWIVLVPKRVAMVEWFDLSEGDRIQLLKESMTAARRLKDMTKAEKINIGALGNVVRQLHVHIVARFLSDAAGAGPVWGVGTRTFYEANALGRFVSSLRAALPAMP
jgi:diadenosine tetraphosphate (Ap4A) HIT family hydrolase